MDLFLNHKLWARRVKAPNQKRGFTLLEVLVAMAVLAITLTSIYGLHAQTLMMSTQARFYQQAPLLALAKLSELERQGISEATGGSGDFGQDYPNFTWSLSIEEVPTDLLEQKKQHLVRIDLTIMQDETESYQLRTYRFYVE